MHSVDVHIRQQLRHAYPPREAANLSRIVCCEMLGQSPTDYYMGKDIPLSAKQKEYLSSVVERLAANEPIQYIQQFAWFLGRRFSVSPDVLIPRPETGELVERILQRTPRDGRILDIGTGSGCIAVTLAMEMPLAQVSAWDVSEAALRVARRNALEWGARVEYAQVDVLRPLPDESLKAGSWDVVVSNPPYITLSEKSGMHPNVWRHEPSLALFVDDADPLLFYKAIARVGAAGLSPGGWLCLEINRAYGADVAALLREWGYGDISVEQDISHNDRFVFARR